MASQLDSAHPPSNDSPSVDNSPASTVDHHPPTKENGRMKSTVISKARNASLYPSSGGR